MQTQAKPYLNKLEELQNVKLIENFAQINENKTLGKFYFSRQNNYLWQKRK